MDLLTHVRSVSPLLDLDESRKALPVLVTRPYQAVPIYLVLVLALWLAGSPLLRLADWCLAVFATRSRGIYFCHHPCICGTLAHSAACSRTSWVVRPDGSIADGYPAVH